VIIQEDSEVTLKQTKWKPDIGYLPTPPQVVEAMLTLAEVTSEDILYDLGSGDGRILITAAQRWGTQGVGIDINPKRVRQGFENAKQAGASDLVTFRQQDLFESDFSEATIVILYLLPHLNLKLRPALFAQLSPGTRILSHDFDMGDWQPDRVVEVQSEDPAILYLWTI
jgi:SAM-dependent methyltransferase